MLLVIDLQRGLFDEQPRPFDADSVIGRINELAARARAAGVPVVLIQHEALVDQLVHGSERWELARGLVTAPTDARLRKTTPDSFLRTGLADLLKGWGAHRLVVCGYASEFCVDTTTRRAAALGYDVTIAADAHTTHDKAHATAAQIQAHHNATLPELTSFGVRIEAVAAREITF